MANPIDIIIRTLFQGKGAETSKKAVNELEAGLKKTGATATNTNNKFKQVNNELGKTTTRAKASTSAFQRMRGSLTGIIAGVGGLVLTLRNFAQASFRQQQVIKQTEAVIKSTGGAAGITAKEVQKMSAELQKVTNVGDEVVQSGANMLLTFTNIGKDVLPDATETMLNMATAMNNGVTPGAELLKTTAVQLGKALNDPINGAVALRRVGVALTDQQLKQIKAFQQQGDIASAQKLIIKELGVEFGGLARSLANPIEQAKNAFGDFKELMGGLVIDILTPLAQLVIKIKDAFDKLSPTAQKLTAVIGLLSLVFGTLFFTIGLIPALIAVVIAAVALIISKFDELRIKVLELVVAFQQKFPLIAGIIIAVFDKVKQTITTFFAVLRIIWEGIVKVFQDLFAYIDGIVKRTQAAIKLIQQVASRIPFLNKVIGKENKLRVRNEEELQKNLKKLEDAKKKREVKEDKVKQKKFKQEQKAATDAQKKKLALERLGILQHQNALTLAFQKGAFDRLQLTQAEQEALVTAQQDTFNTIMSLQTSNNDTLKTVGKAAALTDIAIQTPVAVSKALASAPPPFNFVLAGIVGAAMATQAASVVALKDGGSFVASRPTTGNIGGQQILFGEAGKERVTFEPLNKKTGKATNINNTYNIAKDVDADLVIKKVARGIKSVTGR